MIQAPRGYPHSPPGFLGIRRPRARNPLLLSGNPSLTGMSVTRDLSLFAERYSRLEYYTKELEKGYRRKTEWFYGRNIKRSGCPIKSPAIIIVYSQFLLILRSHHQKQAKPFLHWHCRLPMRRLILNF